MDDARHVESAEKPSQLLKLTRLPDRKAGQNHDHARGEHPEIERLLHGVVDAEPVREPEAQRRDGVAEDGCRADREERPPKMPGENSVDEIDDAVDGEQPHAGKMPLQSAGKPILVVKVDRAVVTAPERKLN